MKPTEKITNFPDDSAPEEGAFIHYVTLEMIDNVAAALRVADQVDALFQRIRKGGPKSPVCFCCEKELKGQVEPPVIALYHTELIPNSAADPRRYRQALQQAKGQAPVDAFIAVCCRCVPDITSADAPRRAQKLLQERLAKDFKRSGMRVDSHHASRVMLKPGNA